MGGCVFSLGVTRGTYRWCSLLGAFWVSGGCLSFRCCFWVASTFSLDGWLALLKSVGSSQVTALLCPAHVGVKSSIQHLIIVIDHRGKAVGKEVDYQDSPG